MYEIIDMPPEDVMGPAMLALNEKQRRFVCAMVFIGDAKKAYAWAGYKISTPGSAQACSSRLSNMDGVAAAIQEEGERRLKFGRSLAITGLLQMASPLGTASEKVRLKALTELADRTGFTSKTEHTLTINDNRTVIQIQQTIEALALANGFDPKKLLGNNVVDAEFTEVDDDLKDLI